MLRREDALRLSEATLRQYKASSNADDYVAITTALQEQVGREFGLDAQVGVMLLRTAESFARDEAERKEMVGLSLYRRHNRCVDGDLQVGDVAPTLLHNVHLLQLIDDPLTSSSVRLFDYLLSGELYDRVLKQYQQLLLPPPPPFTKTKTTTAPTLSGGAPLSSPLPLILFGGSYS